MELLIYMVLSGVLLTATLSVVLSTNRSNSEMLRGMRLQDRWSRLSQLLDLEVAEGQLISYDTDLPAACGATAGTSRRVTIAIPYLPAGAGTTSTTTISYYLRDNPAGGSDLWRCGPPFQADGRLDPTAALVNSPLSNRMGFSVDTNPTSNPDSGRVLRYTIQFLSISSREFKGAARTRVSLFP